MENELLDELNNGQNVNIINNPQNIIHIDFGSIGDISDLINSNIHTLNQNISQISSIVGNNNYEDDDYDSLIELNNYNVKKGIKNIKSIGDIEDNIEKVKCPICNDNDYDKIINTKCNHTFCVACLEEWLKESVKCPICMCEFSE